MTDDEITQKAQSLVDGKTIIKIDGRWALKNSSREGRKCLERLSGGIGIALPWLSVKDGQKEEYVNALKIIKMYERLKNERST